MDRLKGVSMKTNILKIFMPKGYLSKENDERN